MATIQNRDLELLKFVWDNKNLPANELKSLFNVKTSMQQCDVFIVEGRDLVSLTRLIHLVTGIKLTTENGHYEQLELDAGMSVKEMLTLFLTNAGKVLIDYGWIDTNALFDDPIINSRAITHFHLL